MIDTKKHGVNQLQKKYYKNRHLWNPFEDLDKYYVNINDYVLGGDIKFN